MNTHQWPEVKKRLKTTIDQGMKVLKEGGGETRNMVRQAAHLLELEIDIHKLKSRVEQTTYQLGTTVAQSMKNGKFQPTPKIKKINDTH